MKKLWKFYLTLLTILFGWMKIKINMNMNKLNKVCLNYFRLWSLFIWIREINNLREKSLSISKRILLLIQRLMRKIYLKFSRRLLKILNKQKFNKYKKMICQTKRKRRWRRKINYWKKWMNNSKKYLKDIAKKNVLSKMLMFSNVSFANRQTNLFTTSADGEKQI